MAETARATGLFAARLSAWKGPHLAEVRESAGRRARPARAHRAQRRRGGRDARHAPQPSWLRIRKRLRTAQDRVRERLNTMLRSADLAGVIGEAIVTLRGGRYVIPIRAEAKGTGQGHRPRPERVGRDPVHRAAGRRGAEQHLDAGARSTRRARRSASSTSCRARSRRGPRRSRDSLRRPRPRRPVDGTRPARRCRWTPCGRRSPTTRPSCSAPGIRCWAPARCRSTCGSGSGSAIGRWSSPARTRAARPYR